MLLIDQIPNIDIAKELRKAYQIAVRSPDPSSQNGAIVYSPFMTELGSGYNGFTPGVKITPDKLERPKKYLYVEHAERSALHDSITGVCWNEELPYAMVCPWAACADCARGIVLSGIKLLIRHKDAMERKVERWAESIALADEMLKSGGVEIYEYSGSVGGPEIMHLEELWTP